MLPAVPGVAPALLSNPVVFRKKIIKAQDSHNPSLEKQLVSPLSYTHCHSQPRKLIVKPGTNPICGFYSSIFCIAFFLFNLDTCLPGKTVAVSML